MSEAGTVRLPFAAYRAKCKEGQPPLWIQTETGQVGRPVVDRYLENLTVTNDMYGASGPAKEWYRYRVLDKIVVMVAAGLLKDIRQECRLRASLQAIPLLPGLTIKGLGRVVSIEPAHLDPLEAGILGPLTELALQIEEDQNAKSLTVDSASPSHPPSSSSNLGRAAKVLEEAIRLPLLHAQELRRLGVEPERACRGLLLSGPPGGGKTHLVRTLAAAWHLPLVYVAAGQGIISSEVGQAEERLREVFAQAREQAERHSPLGTSLLFIDEIDVLGGKRRGGEGGGSGGSGGRLLGQLLSLMDQAERVMVVGATNRPEALDSALRRAGRFDREIVIEPPNAPERAELLRGLLKRIEQDEQVDLLAIATSARGYVAADLAAVVREAVRQMRKLGLTSLNQTCLEAGLAAIPPSLTRAHRFTPDPQAQWSRIAGYGQQREALQTILQATLNERLTWLGGRAPRGILLHGPAGCGKTLMAQAIANQGQFTVYGVRGDGLYSAYQGESERLLRALFTQARQTAPSLILIDEMEAMVGTRSVGRGGGDDVVRLRILSTLLNEMDGFQSQQATVLVIGCARERNLIDEALLRPGRFDQQVWLDLPSSEDRLAILQLLLTGLPTNANLDYAALVAHSAGWSGARLSRWIQEAATRAMQSGSETINQAHFLP